MRAYLDIVRRILDEGVDTNNRTGIDTRAISGAFFEHDMSEGFPLLTTKKMSTKNIRTELEFFIKGFTDKKWLQDRGNKIWNEWCNPEIVQYGHDDETKRRMEKERDLGPVYGWQWRHLGATYQGYEHDYTGEGIDQLADVVEKLSTTPTDRRMIVTAWAPRDIDKMALPACHYGFQVLVRSGKLDLLWNQRSVDTMLGLPFNIASYGILLHLLAKESGLEEGKLGGFLGDVHIYHNHFDGAKEQISREPLTLPRVETPEFSSIFDWTYKDTKFTGYKSLDRIGFEIAV